MTDSAPRLEAQYLQAAAQQAATYYQVIWQKMGYVLAIQYGSIAAAYVLRGGFLSTFVMAAGFFFTWAMVWAIEHDIRSRDILIAQVNYIALALEPFLLERPPPGELKVPFIIDPFPWADLPHMADWFRPLLARTMQHLHLKWLHIRIIILLLADLVIAVTLLLLPASHTVP
jgi:hypothetical protein